MLLAHSGFIHVLYGGFFGWWGVLGSLLPDAAGLVGWWLYLRQPLRTGSWYEHMPLWARNTYWIMHSVPAAGFLLVVEWMIRVMIVGPLFYTAPAVPVFALGYTTHVFSDWLTHRQDLGDPLLFVTGKAVGVNWWTATWYWTEWAGIGLILLLVAAGAQNTVLSHVAQALPY